MNQKREEYKKKAIKIIKTLKLLGISIFLLGVLVSIVQYTINKSKSNEDNQNIAVDNTDYTINLNDGSVIYEDTVELNFTINSFKEEINYKIIIKINNETIIEQENIDRENRFTIELKSEGCKEFNIIIYQNDEEKANLRRTIYYIEPYISQFLDEYSIFGTQVNYINGSRERYEDSLELIKSAGFKNIRAGLLLGNIWNSDGNYNYSYYDEWINRVTEADINILGLITNVEKVGGNDYKVNTQEEYSAVKQYMLTLLQKYGDKIKYFEILNEPNYGLYQSSEEIKNYADLANEISREVKNSIVGATSGLEVTNSNYTSSLDFFKAIGNETYSNTKIYSIHPYDIENYNNTYNKLNRLLTSHNQYFNELGGFVKFFATEYGVSSNTTVKPKGIDEDVQAYKLVEQSVIMHKYKMDLATQYLFRNTGEDEASQSYNYGLVTYDYKPKKAYYAMKNFLTNTNGAEYIGQLDNIEGRVDTNLDVHVYNKDGKVKIVVWSNNNNENITIPYKNFIATDIYGHEIQPDENGNLVITTSTIYLDNISDNYFYQAISNTVTTKYDEFTQKFADQITKVQGLQTTIDRLKQTMQTINNSSTLNETTAITLMEQHYNLGTTLIQAYQAGTLQIEYVTLSSMLDMLDDIGDSFEDLVTVSATSRNADLSETLNTITTAENKINDEEMEMVYPTKILEFSQDFYDTANYINSLEEENDIKTGLIVSKNLHSKLLAEWASKFADLYINEYITNNPVEITYSTTELTNQPVTATLQTNANITVTNNSNSKTYTFNQNGSFTFEYTIKGQAFQKTAAVNNIDKIAPTITGIQNDKLYLDSVAPQIQDDNLKEVTLSKDGNIVEDYQTNATISEDGYYKIVAIDKAENQTQIEFYISRNPASITYSTTEWTNQDVIATIHSSFEVEVTNNSNNISYRFTQNGEFQFDFSIKGTDLTLTATVNNIDKTPPVITGVEQGGQYLIRTTPVITDDNLQDIKLYLNNELVNNYTSNTELSEEGFYKLIATDKAGNETIIEFTVIEDISEEYQLRNQYILNIENHTTQEEFRNNLKLINNYQILRNGNTLAETDIIATGDILRTNGGEEYTLIVNGDVNKDGEVNIKDMVRLRKYLLERNNLDELELLAADCNLDERPISIKDLVRMRIIVLQRDAT